MQYSKLKQKKVIGKILKFLEQAKPFFEKYVQTYNAASKEWRYALFICPFANLFLFSGFVPFVLIVIYDYIVFTKVND